MNAPFSFFTCGNITATAVLISTPSDRVAPGGKGDQQFAERLVDGVTSNLDHIDGLIKDASTNWRIDRMANVDRNILRLATWELENISETPLKVVLNEAIELSKRFGSEDSSAFVNGVLDRIGSLLRPGALRDQEEPEPARPQPVEG